MTDIDIDAIERRLHIAQYECIDDIAIPHADAIDDIPALIAALREARQRIAEVEEELDKSRVRFGEHMKDMNYERLNWQERALRAERERDEAMAYITNEGWLNDFDRFKERRALAALGENDG